ncbi:hypothetical protein LINPERPRIM_LOCUS31950, partial [Linum perenne]
FYRGAVDGGGAPAVSGGITEGGERGLEGNFEEFCEDEDADASSESCSEVFSPAE